MGAGIETDVEVVKDPGIESGNRKINANPTKEFFISMLTRDIDIKAAILELIDNSIDGAKRMRPDNNYKGLKISLNFNAEQFSIEDNCGGISLDIAENYAFRFGRPANKPKEDGSFTGVFGIGMKRALFRLGNYFSIESTTNKEFFSVDVDVEQWVQNTDQDWAFSFNDDVQENMVNAMEVIGTKIIVSKLHEVIKANFGSTYFINLIVTHISKYRTTAVDNGLIIIINGVPVNFSQDEIIVSPVVYPYSYSYIQNNITIRIIAGCALKGNPENTGWYIYCNGRKIVYADKSEITGWGTNGSKMYHPSLAFFRGYVYFESNDMDKLPWNTTKTGIDTTSRYYVIALDKMKEAIKQISILNNQLANETELDNYEEQILNKNNLVVLTTAKILELTQTNRKFEFFMKEVNKGPVMSSISFKREKYKIDALKKKLSYTNNKQVGEKAFDFYWEEIGDE